MDMDWLQRLITLMAHDGIRELEIEEDGRIVRLQGRGLPASQAPVASSPPAVAHISQPIRNVPGEKVIEARDFGVLHLAPSPETPPYIVVGQDISIGQQIGLLEAMKVFSPIVATQAGRVAKIPVQSGSEVEPGQVLVVLS